MSFLIKNLGKQDYVQTYEAMRAYNEQRTPDSIDEIWLLEHEPVYTLGLSGKEEHLLNAGNIPVINTDRGGQVTYHGPGQLIAYTLIDLNNRPYKIKQLVNLIEQSIIEYLQSINIIAERKQGAPGVYVNNEKIAALGIRVRKNCTYHGLAINVDMDLTPYNGINPCGYAGLRCTQIANYIDELNIQDAKFALTGFLLNNLDVMKDSFSNVA